jgi:hypothetical protein
VPARGSHRATRALNADGAIAVGKQVAAQQRKGS